MSKAASLFNSKPIEVKENPDEPKSLLVSNASYKDDGSMTRKAKLRLKKANLIAQKLLANPKKDFNQKRPYAKDELSVAQVNERETRTIFVGNVGIKTKKKTLLKAFKKYGQIENMWVRSLPLDLKSKINMKGIFYFIKFLLIK